MENRDKRNFNLKFKLNRVVTVFTTIFELENKHGAPAAAATM